MGNEGDCKRLGAWVMMGMCLCSGFMGAVMGLGRT